MCVDFIEILGNQIDLGIYWYVDCICMGVDYYVVWIVGLYSVMGIINGYVDFGGIYIFVFGLQYDLGFWQIVDGNRYIIFVRMNVCFIIIVRILCLRCLQRKLVFVSLKLGGLDGCI